MATKSKFPEYKPEAVKTKKAAKGSARDMNLSKYYEPVMDTVRTQRPKKEPGK